MKIENLTLLQQVQKTAQEQNGTRKTSDPASAQAPASAVARLSEAARDDSQDIDPARVETLRQAISEGRLEINSDRIAESLIENVYTMLNKG
ncbi:MAG: flagellar biosynthesis anti-sigma factor FlgM [Pseudohongiellaceae bacterium]